MKRKKRQIETYTPPQFSDGMWVSNLDEEEDLSLILTSQNPARIDVRTLRKKKVIIIPTNVLYGSKNIRQGCRRFLTIGNPR